MEESLSSLSELQRLVFCEQFFGFVMLIIYDYKQGIISCIARILFQSFFNYGCSLSKSSLYPFHISHFTFLRKFCSPSLIFSKA